MALVNPFSQSVRGVKIPDYNAFPSATWVTQYSKQLVTNSDGDCAFGLRPRVKGFYIPATLSSGTITWGTPEDATGYSSFSGLFNGIRCVAAGLRITYIGSEETCAGRFAVCHVPESSSTGGTTQYPVDFGGFESQPLHATSTCLGLLNAPFMSSCKLVDVDAIDYQPLDTASNDGWTDVLVIFRGLPVSKECINVELIAHWEALPNNMNIGIGVTPAARNDSAATSAGFYASQATPVATPAPTPTLGGSVGGPHNFLDVMDGFDRAMSATVGPNHRP